MKLMIVSKQDLLDSSVLLLNCCPLLTSTQHWHLNSFSRVICQKLVQTAAAPTFWKVPWKVDVWILEVSRICIIYVPLQIVKVHTQVIGFLKKVLLLCFLFNHGLAIFNCCPMRISFKSSLIKSYRKSF